MMMRSPLRLVPVLLTLLTCAFLLVPMVQSVLGVTIFYGTGFGLVGRLPILGFYAYAVGLFALQAWFSHWWVSCHAQGPMEALWRRWTYGRRP